jgi:hypothetical protein
MSAEAFGSFLLVIGIMFGVVVLALLVLSLVWVYRDAQGREGTGCLWSLLMFLSWPLGLLIYALLRRKAMEANGRAA